MLAPFMGIRDWISRKNDSVSSFEWRLNPFVSPSVNTIVQASTPLLTAR